MHLHKVYAIYTITCPNTRTYPNTFPSTKT